MTSTATAATVSVHQNGISGVAHDADEDKFEEIEIPVPWGHISGKWWGSRNKQPILAIHGWQDNSGTFDRLAPLLVDAEHSLLCIDLPGHGLSSHYPSGMFYYIFWDGIIVVRRIVNYFKWKKITMLGHSLGGAISFLYAASFPEDIDRYISIDIASPSVREPSKIVSLIGNSIDKMLHYEKLKPENMPCYQYNEMIKIVVNAYAGSVDDKACEIMMKRGMYLASKDDSENNYYFARDPRLKIASLGFFTLDQVLEFASKIRCKVMNIRANPGMKFDNPEHYKIVLDKIGETAEKLICHEIKGTHHLHLNDPNSVFGVIAEFLEN